MHYNLLMYAQFKSSKFSLKKCTTANVDSSQNKFLILSELIGIIPRNKIKITLHEKIFL